MYLLDSNIFVEVLLQQARSEEVKAFLESTPRGDLRLSEFSLYSIGVILFRRKMKEAFQELTGDLLVEGGIQLVRLGLNDMRDVAEASRRYDLDFDDAYQYAAAEKYDLTLVSFDADFDKTERGRKTPAEASRT